MHRRIAAVALAAAGALAVPAAADAHVTVQPRQAPAGGFTVLNVRVPNERDDASTVKVDVKLPPGFATASYQSTPGWRVRVVKEHLAQPLQTDDGPVHEQVDRVVWTATGAGGGIAPGQFRDFPLSVQIPGKAGQTLTFKALQTYDNGTVVRWIGAPGSDEPAPQVELTDANAPAGSGGGASAGQGAGASANSGSESNSGSGRGSNTLGIIALVVGALGLIAGGAALASARRGSGGVVAR